MGQPSRSGGTVQPKGHSGGSATHRIALKRGHLKPARRRGGQGAAVVPGQRADQPAAARGMGQRLAIGTGEAGATGERMGADKPAGLGQQHADRHASNRPRMAPRLAEPASLAAGHNPMALARRAPRVDITMHLILETVSGPKDAKRLAKLTAGRNGHERTPFTKPPDQPRGTDA